MLLSLEELSLDCSLDELSLSLDEDDSLEDWCEDSSGLFGVHAQRSKHAIKSIINILFIYPHFPQSEQPEHIILFAQVSQFFRNRGFI